MKKEEILIASKRGNKLKFKVCDRAKNEWTPKKYEKVLACKDYNMLAFLFYDLHSMGFPVEKAYIKFKSMMKEPELFFL